ncbi:MAG: hypothetical protein ACE5EJ_05765, partial [Nitrosopumilaceae archaeon]
MLDKNPEQKPIDSLTDITTMIEQNTMNSIMYSDPFLKTAFLTQIISTTQLPKIYLDFDLLFSGYTLANMVLLPQNVTLFQPTKNDWNETLKTVLLRLSEEKSLLVIDSLNNFFNLFDDRKEVGRLIDSYIMLLVCTAKMSKSCILLNSMARRKNGEGWVLSTTGRHIAETNSTTKIQ